MTERHGASQAGSGAARIPAVTVLMCTRNRHANVTPSVRAVLACDYANFELLVLDQSDDRQTEEVLRPLGVKDVRLRYVRLDFVGKPRALNQGLKRSRGDYVLITDDDCEPTPEWISAMVAALRADPTLGCVFGDVSAVDHDETLGYIPICRIAQPAKIARLSQFVPVPPHGLWGMGANMGFPMGALRQVMGWDPCIGPGARFGSGDDMDMSVRILRAGYAIGLCPESRVVHSGFRKWTSGWRDRGRTGLGMGAIFAKHLRSGAFFGGALNAMVSASAKVLLRVAVGKRQVGLAYPLGWLRGFAAGMAHPVDRASAKFVGNEDPVSERAYGDQFASIEWSVPPSRRDWIPEAGRQTTGTPFSN